MNKLKYSLLSILTMFLIGCSANVTEEDLIGGFWVATAGYENGKPKGEAYCSSVVTDGLEFKDEETVYVEAYDQTFTYWLEEDKVYFSGEDLGLHISYYIDKISDDEVGLTGDNLIEESCYLERQ